MKTNFKWLGISLLVLAVVWISGFLSVLWMVDKNEVPKPELAKVSRPEVSPAKTCQTGLQAKLEKPIEDSEVLELAWRYVRKLKVAAYHQLTPHLMTNPLRKVVTFEVRQGSLPVVGMRIQVLVRADGTVEELENTYHAIEEVKRKNSDLSVREAQGRLSARYAARELKEEDASVVVFYRPAYQTADLAYTVSVRDKLNRQPAQIVVRASDAQVLSRTVGYGEHSHRTRR